MKVTKRSIETSGHDIAIAAGFGIVGGASLLLTGCVVWYFRRQAYREEKLSRNRIDLLEGYPSVTVDVEKALQERPHSIALSLASTVLSTDTRTIIVAPPTPVTPVHTTTRRRTIDMIRPLSSTGEISHSPGTLSRTRDFGTSSDATTSNRTTIATPFIRVPAPAASALYYSSGSRLKIPTREDVSSPVLSEVTETSVGRLPSVYYLKSARKRRPSDLVILSHILPGVDEKRKATPNVPASPSRDEWSSGPVATPLTSYTVQIPAPSSAGLPFHFRDVGSPLTITAAYPLSSVTIEDISRGGVHDGAEVSGRIVKLSVLLEDSLAPRQLASEENATPAEDLDRTDPVRSSPDDLPPYTPINEHNNR